MNVLKTNFDVILVHVFQQNFFVMSLAIRTDAWIKQIDVLYLLGGASTILRFDAMNIRVVQEKTGLSVKMENVKVKCFVVLMVLDIFYSMILVQGSMQIKSFASKSYEKTWIRLHSILYLQ